jgi:hypothetical protein
MTDLAERFARCPRMGNAPWQSGPAISAATGAFAMPGRACYNFGHGIYESMVRG